MNVDELVRDSLREQATEQPPLEPGFADRVLTARRRRRTQALASVAAATAAVVAVAVAVPLLDSGKDDVRLASEMNTSDIIAHPDQTPPRDLIAAGDVALAAYYTWSNVKQTDDRAVAVRTYRLLDQKTGKYVKTTKWSFIDVAPGMRTAAVLEKDLPAKRIGLLNLLTGEVERWIPVDRGVAGVEFSPDGSKLVATTYSKNPDLRYKADYDSDGDGKKNDWMPQFGQSSRTGFYVIDVDSGKGSWSKATYNSNDLNVRQDFDFSHDGKLVYSGLTTAPHMQYYDFEGNEVAKPANERYVHWFNDAGLSPDGKLVGGNGAVLDAYSGKQAAKVHGQRPLAWADNERLVAWYSEPGTNEFHNRLVLITIGSDKVVPLSGFRKGNDGAAGRWTPIFAER
ncbi:WD40 repeat domain-containing protein [Streptomyces himalayensis]|uniref:WD40 repeat domain-containing protein n=1 Tax=Streptomyces himalayensis subsp. himalayensis TaxID=2756131 RepID=A0A7W0IAE8_9ACTN|nr:WD40 repeat domain-containing protein [Streptomyces himalayensis]MBA2948347.1 WD40 repeat domain-containing protein [Streptomyces himalayensis subsp. himalayensis]